MILSSSSKNLFALHLIIFIMTIAGFYYVDFSISNILTCLIFFYLYSVFGVSLTLHRFYSHKTFVFKHSILKWLFTFVSLISCRGSVLGWVYIHRIHHAHADTKLDPHSPHNNHIGFLGSVHLFMNTPKINPFVVKDLLGSFHIWVDRYYIGILILWGIVLTLLGYNILYFAWLLPICIVHITQNCFNYFAHKHGYRNIETKDRSTNCILLWPFILGDAWHNNHHSIASNYSSKIKWWEFDPLVLFINVVRR